MPFVNNISGKFGFGHPTAYKPGSLQFISAQSQYLEVAATTIGTSTATIEFWFNATGTTNQRLVTTTTSTFVSTDFGIRYSGGSFIAGSGSVGSAVTASTTPLAGVWNHVAWVGVSGTSQSLYLNGSRVGTGGAYNLTDLTPIFFIGGRNITAEYFDGYISNFRYIRGTAVYSGASYTVPTGTLYSDTGTELLLQTLYGPNVTKDSSPNNYTIIYHGIPNDPVGSTTNPFS